MEGSRIDVCKYVLCGRMRLRQPCLRKMGHGGHHLSKSPHFAESAVEWGRGMIRSDEGWVWT